jgi:hypothetical protein
MTNTHQTSHVATQLARQAKKAVDAFHAADEARTYTGGHIDRLVALQHEVSYHPAGSGEGALFQLAALQNIIERHSDDNAPWRAAERLLAHLVAYVEEASGADRGSLQDHYFTSSIFVETKAA